MVEIFVKPFGATQFQKLDIREDVSIPITYSIADIRNPEKREGSFTKTIALPGTKINNTLFGNIFKISKSTFYATDFNPNKKADCLILEDSIEIFKGSLRLADINYLEDGEIVYNCVVFGQTTDLFFSLGNTLLTDLFEVDDALNHAWTRSNIVTSWSAPVGVGYVYPMIDYGDHLEETRNTWDTKEFYPAVYVKEYFERIFEKAGYTYTSAFLNSTTDIFNKLIIPYNKGVAKKTVDEIAFNSAEVIVTPTVNKTQTLTKLSQGGWNNLFYTSYTYGYTLQSAIPYYRELSDPSSSFISSGSSNLFTVPKTGFYNITNVIGINNAVLNNPPAASGYNYVYRINVFAKIFNVTTSTTVKDQLIYSINETDTLPQTHVPYDYQTGNIALTAGHVLSVLYRFEINYFLSNLNNSIPTYLPIFSWDMMATNCNLKFTLLDFYQQGEILSIKSFIPEKILCKDFFSSIVKMFNLYIEPDKNNSKNLLIEPRNEYYSTETQVLNWSDKVNRDIPWKITPLGELDFKSLVFSYKEDKDYDNQSYKYKWGEVYGSKIITIDNDFLTNEKKIEPIFSATPTVVDDENWNNSRAIPRIINESIGQTASVIRILYYGGLIDSEQWTFIENGNRQAKTQYPYSGMNNHPEYVDIDLCFDMPLEVFWKIDNKNYLNNNLYNIYYYKMINEIIDVDSKLLELEVLLTAQDLFNINFGKKIFIDDTYYILNKIIDADRTQTQLCKVELLKLKYGVNYVGGQSRIVNNVQRKKLIEIVDGGENIVGSSLNGPPAIVEGGLNEVRSLGATSEIIILTGGLN